MKYILASIAAALILMLPPLQALGENGTQIIIDRVEGTYRLECSGYRTDDNTGLDWTLHKNNMDYLTYGIGSHLIIDGLNKMYLDIGDKALKDSGIWPDGIPVPGVNR